MATNYEKWVNEKRRNPKFREGMNREYWRARFAYEIAELRKKKKISQKELAKRIGTTQSAVARAESGKEDLRLSTIQKMANVLDYDLRLVSR